MNKDELIEEQMTVTHQMGGMLEFQRTGVYPNKLIVHSMKYNQTWRIKVKNDIQTGVLNIKKVPVYNYKFDDKGFFYQKLENGVAASDWIASEMIMMLAD